MWNRRLKDDGGLVVYHAETGRKVWNLATLREVENYFRFSMKDNKGGRCIYIQVKKERTGLLTIDSDDIPVIICCLTCNYLLICWWEAGS